MNGITVQTARPRRSGTRAWLGKGLSGPVASPVLGLFGGISPRTQTSVSALDHDRVSGPGTGQPPSGWTPR